MGLGSEPVENEGDFTETRVPLARVSHVTTRMGDRTDMPHQRGKIDNHRPGQKGGRTFFHAACDRREGKERRGIKN